MSEAAERKRRSSLKVVNVRLVKEPSLYSDEKIMTPEDAVHVVANELKTYDRECFAILSLKTSGKPINLNVVSIGTLDSSLVGPRETFKAAILSNAAAVIAIHNHPSGNIDPSHEDIMITERLVKAGQILGIPVMDHIIVGGETGTMLSMNRMGYMDRDSKDWER